MSYINAIIEEVEFKSNTNQHGNFELKDNEIIKALEVCNSLSLRCGDGCPYYEVPYKNGKSCSEMMIEDALALINHLKAENEALINGQETLQNYIAEKNAEIERLQKEKFKGILVFLFLSLA